MPVYVFIFPAFTLQGKNNVAGFKRNPRDVNFMLVLKSIFGGSPKITLQNMEITRKVKNSPKRFLG